MELIRFWSFTMLNMWTTYKLFINNGIESRNCPRFLALRLRCRVVEGGNPESGVVPEMMLHKDLLPANFTPNLKHSIGKVGMHHFDLSSTVTGGTSPIPSVESDVELTCARYMDFCLCRCTNCIDSNRSSIEINPQISAWKYEWRKQCRNGSYVCTYSTSWSSCYNKSVWRILLFEQCHYLCFSLSQSSS